MTNDFENVYSSSEVTSAYSFMKGLAEDDNIC